MIPSTLVRIENFDGFLGTFDNITWWRSQIIPGVESIIDVAWIYGEYHICACKMDDGTYSIWQSYDYGNHWREQLNTAEAIKCIVRPDYGRALIGTSGGWWGSENAGTDWTKVSTVAPNCHTVTELTKNILVALDGTYIWRSTNGGTTWTKAVILGTSTPATAKTSYPTVAGTAIDCIVGCWSTNVNPSRTENQKDILLYSDDGARSFAVLSYDYLFGWINRDGNNTNHQSIITDIEMTGLISSDGLPTFVIQTLMSVGYTRIYFTRRFVGATGLLHAFPKFDAYATPGKSLESYEVNVSGTTSTSRVTTFAGKTSDNRPLLKLSIDGGITWTDADPTTASVYAEPDNIHLTTNPFIDDNYLMYSWGGAGCHNGYHFIGGYWEKYQSYEMDIYYVPSVDKTWSYSMGMWMSGIVDTYYKMHGGLIAVHSESYDQDVIKAITLEKSYEMDLIDIGTASKTYWMHRYMQGKPTSSYNMNCIILKNTFPEIIINQGFNIIFPLSAESGYPHDSRKEE